MRQDGFELRLSRDNQFYYVKKAANGEVLMTSETYTRLQSARDGALAAGADPAEGPLELVNDENEGESWMAKLTTKRRKKLKKSSFGLPGRRAYPMHDKAHAANAKARATQQYRKGRISKSTMQKIHAKANKKLGKRKTKRKSSGRKRRAR
jgi:uncharacterized protein YegP (UPF0339 family)